MPTLTADQLLSLGKRILTGAGVPAEDAAVVAAELRDANLCGHDSHGVMRLVQYVQMIEDGFVKPGSEFEVLRDAPGYAVANAHFNLGQIAAIKALEIGIAKAREQGTATVFVRDCNHVGRLGSYTHRAAVNGFAALMAVNAPGPGGVAPFGGIDRRLGTTPISLAVPWEDDAFVLDMTTSATAEGKLRVAFQKGEPVAEGLIIDGYGNPSTDPAVYYNKPYGAILPLGGPGLGHKGYGLSVMLDLFCGVLSGSGVAREDLPRGANGVWLHLMQVQRFIDRDEYDRWVERYVAHIKSARRLPDVDEILLPGEIERRRSAQRTAEGVPIPDETWRQIGETAERLGVPI